MGMLEKRHFLISALTLCAAILPTAAAETHHASADQLDMRRETILATADAQSIEALTRRERTNEILALHGIPVNEALPARNAVEDTTRRSRDEVVDRLIALTITAVHASEADEALTLSLIEQFRADTFFTEAEQAFLVDPDPDMALRAQYSWQFENVEVLLWALGFRDMLLYPSNECDVDAIANTILTLGNDGLRSRARLRSQAELMDQADFVYRTHWAVRQAQLEREAVPAGLLWDVVYERHYTLNWLIGYMDQSWDEVSTDT